LSTQSSPDASSKSGALKGLGTMGLSSNAETSLGSPSTSSVGVVLILGALPLTSLDLFNRFAVSLSNLAGRVDLGIFNSDKGGSLGVDNSLLALAIWSSDTPRRSASFFAPVFATLATSSVALPVSFFIPFFIVS
jgi:hypothetical protein